MGWSGRPPERPGLADGVGAQRQRRGLETSVGAAGVGNTPFPDSEIHIFLPFRALGLGAYGVYLEQ